MASLLSAQTLQKDKEGCSLLESFFFFLVSVARKNKKSWSSVHAAPDYLKFLPPWKHPLETTNEEGADVIWWFYVE